MSELACLGNATLAFPICCLSNYKLEVAREVDFSYSIAFLKLHELIDTLVLSYVVVVCHNAFAVLSALLKSVFWFYL